MTIRSWRKRVAPLLADRFVPQTAASGRERRINDIDEFVKLYPEIKEIIGDGNEFKTQRPKRKQGKNYTCKSKRHVKKTVLVVNRDDGLFLGRTGVRPGSVHDKRILDEDAMHRRLDKHAGILKRMDSAWTGEDPSLDWVVNRRGRRNHPLTDQEKTVVIRQKGAFDALLDVAMNLVNFNLFN